MLNIAFRCLVVRPADPAAGETSPVMNVVSMPADSLPPGEVTIRVHWSSLNYKDALASTGHRGIVKTLPHVPGIDASGVVVESTSPDFSAGDAVVVSGYDLGQGHWGGWSERIRVPAAWVVPLPIGLSSREAMIYGTAGFTAAQCVMALQTQDVMPGSGEVVVTGATGGVGSLALRLLAMLGYRVVAVTGKRDWHRQLIAWGAVGVIDRADFADDPARPMLSGRWAGGVDTVGGGPLVRMIKETAFGGGVAACGLVAGADLSMTLYPFLLRGVALCGIASADCPRDKRLRIWEMLAGPWKLPNLEDHVTEVSLETLPITTRKMLSGQTAGRIIVHPAI
jgi:acrylyl-CoA reductase (NADPH)